MRADVVRRKQIGSSGKKSRAGEMKIMKQERMERKNCKN